MAVIVPIVTTFNAKGINKAVSDFKKLETTGQKVAFGMRGVDQATGSLVKGIAKVGAVAGLVGGVIGTKLVSAAYESQKVMKATQQLVITTGNAARISAQGVAELSSKLSEQIGVDDELIQQSANLILTFKQVKNEVGAGNDIFNQAVTLAQDLGHLFGSSSGAAMQLGKALADPTRGITALRKAGINFTEAQQQQIKALVATGDLLGAQKIVLGEVESQVGGLAKATATDFDRMKVAVGNVVEDFGTLLLPVIEQVSRYIIEKTVPFFKELASVIGEEGLGGGIKFAIEGFVNFISNLDGTGTAIFLIVGAIAALRGATIAYNIVMGLSSVILPIFATSLRGATAAQTQLNVAMYANPIGLVVAAVVALIALLVFLYIRFDVVRKAVGFLGDALKFVFVNTIAAVQNYFISFINLAIMGVNILIKAANFFGADIEEVGLLSYKAFSTFSSSAKKATRDVAGVQEGLRGVRNEERAMEGKSLLPPVDPPGPTGTTAKQIETAKEKLEKYTGALNKVKDAGKSLTQANKSVVESQKRVTAATQQVTDAQTKLAQSVIAVEEAEARLEKVRQGLGSGSDESKKAARAVEDAQRDLEDSGYAVEDAQYQLIDAEKELIDIRANSESSLRDIREAEISFARAKLSLTEATLGQKDKTVDLSEAQKEYDEITNGATEGTDRYKEALDGVTEAKKANTEATRNLQEARDNEIEANSNLVDSIDKVAAAQWSLFDAEKALSELRKTTGSKIIAKAEADVEARETAPPGFGPTVTPIVGTGNSEFDAIVSRFTDKARDVMLERGGFVQAFANGGIVTSPMMGMVGEAGSEAIIPLDRLGDFGGQTINVTINAGIGTDASKVGDEIVNVLQRYNRRNGALPLKVA